MSLHDIIMQRAAIHFQNENLQGPLGALAEGLGRGVSQGIEQEKNMMLEKRKRLAALDEATEKRNKANSNASKLDDINFVIGKDSIPIYSSVSTSETETFSKLQEKATELGGRIPRNREEALSIIAEDTKSDDLYKKNKLDLDIREQDLMEDKEVRLIQGEERRQKKLIIDNAKLKMATEAPVSINVSDPGEIDAFLMDELGIDMEQSIQIGLAERSALNPNVITLKPKAERTRLISQKTISESAQTYIGELKDSKDLLQESVKMYKDIGLDELKPGWDLFQQLANPAGPLSVQSHSALVRELNQKNPKLAALWSKLERAFQKYRIETTGVQASDKELSRLRPLIPHLGQNPESFLLTAKDIISELDMMAGNRIGTWRAGQRDKVVVDGLESLYFGKDEDVGHNAIKRTTDNSPVPEVTTQTKYGHLF